MSIPESSARKAHNPHFDNLTENQRLQDQSNEQQSAIKKILNNVSEANHGNQSPFACACISFVKFARHEKKI